ncbi:hypothetical protein OL548_00595 [Lysinibacillus sp. MHQ-1]|nr:hypothetical protein OL548_00595 [Lysinibacillus sp. MHQ-1]
MSTVAACYVATSGIVTKNIYLDFINRNPDPKKLLRFSRSVILSSALLGLVLAISFQKVIDLAYLAWDVIFCNDILANRFRTILETCEYTCCLGKYISWLNLLHCYFIDICP